MILIPYIIAIILSSLGFLLAFYIHHTKRNKEVLVCPVGTTCDGVVHSEFSRFLGVGVEVWGMVYYALIVGGYGFSLVFSGAYFDLSIFILLGFSMVAFLFSLYLTFVQAFFLKQWCTWCLISAGLCTIIFFLPFYFLAAKVGIFLTEYQIWVSVLHTIGLAVGLGSATVADVLFFKFLKDRRISELEADIMRTVSHVVWVSLAIIFISGLGFYLPFPAGFAGYPVFTLKTAIFLIIILTGSLLNLLIAPKFVRISFGKKHDHEMGELTSLRHWAFILGGISMASWYSLFVLSLLPADMEISLRPLLYIYTGVLLVAILGSGVADRRITTKEV
ncbi:MAG: vitamin K epoxide reductase family protein [bacterium]|nr:vitamin K epoxide reductase family protein [bacterium]